MILEPVRGDRGLCYRVFLVDDYDCHWDAEPASLIVFDKRFRVAGTDTTHNNATVRTYRANYERHNHAVVPALPNNGGDAIR